MKIETFGNILGVGLLVAFGAIYLYGKHVEKCHKKKDQQ